MKKTIFALLILASCSKLEQPKVAENYPIKFLETAFPNGYYSYSTNIYADFVALKSLSFGNDNDVYYLEVTCDTTHSEYLAFVKPTDPRETQFRPKVAPARTYSYYILRKADGAKSETRTITLH